MKPAQTKQSFKTVLRNSILKFSIGLVAIFSLVMYLSLNFVGSQLIATANRDSNEAMAEVIEVQLYAYEDFIERYFVNPVSYMSLEVLSNQRSIYELLYRFVNEQAIKSVFYIISPDGQTLFTNAITESPYNSNDIFLTGIFRQLKRDPNQTITSLNKIQLQNNYRTVYSMGRGIVVNELVLAYVLFDFLESDFNHLIQSSSVDIVVLSDQYENAIVSTNNTILDTIGKFKPILDEDNAVRIQNTPYYLYTNEILDGRMKIHTLSSLGFLGDFFVSSLVLLSAFALISSVVIWVASRNYANTKTKALDALISAIEKVQTGDLDVRLSIDSGDEFEEVGVYFNRMLENLSALIVENNELMSRTNLSEIKQLQAQFNPHFLFNALESFKYLIRTDTTKAESFILRLAQLLRYSIQSDKDFVTLKDDMAYIETYLDIQSLRYGSRFTYALDIQPDLMACVLPKLIIQPIVENSFQHGDTQGNLHIDIYAERKAQHLIITIKDNGQGLSKAALKELNKILDSETNLSDHLGLYNVHRRIQLMYGERYGIKLQTKPQAGLSIQITLPYQRKEDHA